MNRTLIINSECTRKKIHYITLQLMSNVCDLMLQLYLLLFIRKLNNVSDACRHERMLSSRSCVATRQMVLASSASAVQCGASNAWASGLPVAKISRNQRRGWLVAHRVQPAVPPSACSMSATLSDEKIATMTFRHNDQLAESSSFGAEFGIHPFTEMSTLMFLNSLHLLSPVDWCLVMYRALQVHFLKCLGCVYKRSSRFIDVWFLYAKHYVTGLSGGGWLVHWRLGFESCVWCKIGPLSYP